MCMASSCIVSMSGALPAPCVKCPRFTEAFGNGLSANYRNASILTEEPSVTSYASGGHDTRGRGSRRIHGGPFDAVQLRARFDGDARIDAGQRLRHQRQCQCRDGRAHLSRAWAEVLQFHAHLAVLWRALVLLGSRGPSGRLASRAQVTPTSPESDFWRAASQICRPGMPNFDAESVGSISESHMPCPATRIRGSESVC